MTTSLLARGRGFVALLALTLVTTSATAFGDDASAPADPDAPPPKPPSRIVANLEGAFGTGALRVGKLAPDGLSGSLARAPITVEELTPSFGLRTRNGSVTLVNPLVFGVVEGSRTAIGTGNLTLKNDLTVPFNEHVAARLVVHVSLPTGTSEDQPTERWGSERNFTDSALTGGAVHAAARAMTGYTMATMWDSHRWGVGTHFGLRLSTGATSFEPYFGSDSRLSFTGRSSPGALFAGVRNESRVSSTVTIGAELWGVLPDPDLRTDELSASAAFAQVDAGFGLGRLKGTLAAMMPIAGPADGPRVFAFRAAMGTNF